MRRTIILFFVSITMILLCGCEGITIEKQESDSIQATTMHMEVYEDTVYVSEEETTNTVEPTTEEGTTAETTTETQTTSVEPTTEATTMTMAVESTEQVTEAMEPPPMPTEAADSYTIYYVQSGDWFNHIAYIYGIDPEYLAQYNYMSTDDVIHPGDIIKIPSGYVLQDYSDGLVCYGSETKTSWTAGGNSFTNMEIASGVLTNDVAYIPPGGDFSWLRDVGPCTGPPYVESTGYSGGEVVTVYGGGICMTASALKVAAMNAGCVITETHPHSLPVTYNDRSNPDWALYESAIDASGCDLKFYNPSQTTGLTIRVYTDRYNGTCTAELIPD